MKHYPYAQYAVITNYDTWEMHKVENGNLVTSAINLEGIIEDVFSKGVKVSLSTENVRNMFRPIVVLEKELRHVFKIYSEKNSALFEAYRNIIKRLYEKASEDDIETLFIKHTLMQMIV